MHVSCILPTHPPVSAPPTHFQHTRTFSAVISALSQEAFRMLLVRGYIRCVPRARLQRRCNAILCGALSTTRTSASPLLPSLQH
jgi:hypothetical protein